MKRFLVALSIVSMTLLTTLFTAQLAHAEENGFYISGGIGSFDLDLGDAYASNGTGFAPFNFTDVQSSDALLLNFKGGYNWGNWALEFELQTTKGGNVVSASKHLNNNYDFLNYGIYGVYRTAGQFYLMGKFGLSKPKLDFGGSTLEFDEDIIGTFGVGGGYRFSPSTSLEIDLSQSIEDSAVLSVGLRYNF